MLIVIEMSKGHTLMLFGNKSALRVKISRALVSIKKEVSTIRVQIASNFGYPAKILYSYKIRIQHWLRLCKEEVDRSTINDRIINMDPVIEQILNSSLTINLPPVFTIDTTNPTVKEDGATPSGKLDDAKKKGKKCKGKRDYNAATKFIKNKNTMEAFKLKEGEDWHRDFSGKSTNDRAKWNENNCWMCAKWHTKGDCSSNCNNKDSHVEANTVSEVKKNKYLNFLAQACSGDTTN
jgi:hypothetical protein